MSSNTTARVCLLPTLIPCIFQPENGHVSCELSDHASRARAQQQGEKLQTLNVLDQEHYLTKDNAKNRLDEWLKRVQS